MRVRLSLDDTLVVPEGDCVSEGDCVRDTVVVCDAVYNCVAELDTLGVNVRDGDCVVDAVGNIEPVALSVSDAVGACEPVPLCVNDTVRDNDGVADKEGVCDAVWEGVQVTEALGYTYAQPDSQKLLDAPGHVAPAAMKYLLLVAIATAIPVCVGPLIASRDRVLQTPAVHEATNTAPFE